MKVQIDLSKSGVQNDSFRLTSDIKEKNVMMSEFGSLGDGINSRLSSSSRSSNDRLYPSLFESDEEESPDSDCFSSSVSVASESRSTPPLTRRRNVLFPVNELVDNLRPEEVRWFYKPRSDNIFGIHLLDTILSDWNAGLEHSKQSMRMRISSIMM